MDVAFDEQNLKQNAYWLLSRFRLPSRKKGKCCIFKPDGLGDLVLAAGAIEQLNRHFGAENCTLITSHLNHAGAEFLFPRNPKLYTGYYLGGWRHGEPVSSFLGVMPKLSRIQFDTLVSLRHQSPPPHHAMLLAWINAEKQYGVSTPQSPSWHRFREGNLFYPKADAGTDDVCLELEAHAAVLTECIGTPFRGRDLKPRLEGMPGEGYLLFNPYASVDKKQYPIPKWVEVVEQTERENPGLVCRVSCPPSRLVEGKALFKGRVTPATSFREYYESIAKADAVVTIDTATAHLSTAMDKPTVVVIGGAHFGMFGPWKTSERQVWINHEVPCYGCGWPCTQSEVTCLTAITPSEVVTSVNALLASVRKGN